MPASGGANSNSRYDPTNVRDRVIGAWEHVFEHISVVGRLPAELCPHVRGVSSDHQPWPPK